jgi:hypothetical protein
MRVCVTNNNGFWIGWLDLLALLYIYSQLWPLTVNDCLRPAPFLPVLRVSFLLLWLTWLWFTSPFVVRSLTFTSEQITLLRLNQSESESYITTDGQSVSLSWNEAPIWGIRPYIFHCQTLADLLIWGYLSDERTCLSFAMAAGLRQRSHFRVSVPWDSWSYFSVSDSDSRLSISSTP